MNAYLVKPRRRRAGKVIISPFWSIRWRLESSERWHQRPLRVRDKEVASEKLRAFKRDAERRAAGIALPDELVAGASKSLADHLSDYLAELSGARRDAMYVYNVRVHVERLLRECGWNFPKEVTAGLFCHWRCGVKRSPKTLNDYLADMSGLLNWMVRRGRLLANPLLSVEKVSTSGTESARRALSEAEVSRLLAVSGSRKPVYLLAVLTGLRRSEIDGLRWGDVHLDALKPFLRVRASTTKNGKPAQIWLRDDLVEELRRLRPASLGSALAVFPGGVPSMDQFREDLAAAGIEKSDWQGRRVDFHSLRHTLATNLARSGVAPRVAMEIMRHSDMRLTMKTYTDVDLLPTSDAVERLPRFASVAGVVSAVATGTDGDSRAASRAIVLEGQIGSQSVNSARRIDQAESGKIPAESSQVSPAVLACHQDLNIAPSRTRT